MYPQTFPDVSLCVSVSLSWRAQSLGVTVRMSRIVLSSLGCVFWACVQVPVGLLGNCHDVLTLKLSQTADIIDQLPLLSSAVRMTPSLLPLTAQQKTKGVSWSWQSGVGCGSN